MRSKSEIVRVTVQQDIERALRPLHLRGAVWVIRAPKSGHGGRHGTVNGGGDAA